MTYGRTWICHNIPVWVVNTFYIMWLQSWLDWNNMSCVLLVALKLISLAYSIPCAQQRVNMSVTDIYESDILLTHNPG